MQPTTEVAAKPGNVGVPIEAVTAGHELTTSRGSHFVVDGRVDDPTDGYLPGRSSCIARSFNVLASTPDRAGSGDMLFLDTETTGLDRGTGTHVFLVGLGYFEGDRFRVEQHFLRDLHEEGSLLCELQRLLQSFSMLVTFNGRGFDWPLLSNKFILHGYRDIPVLQHWDLLTPSRRVWRNRLRDCSLGSLERNVLDVHRTGDIPGFLIPQLYFDYLRSRDAGPLKPVFSHNHIDIVSLARLAARLLRTEDDPFLMLEDATDRISFGCQLLNSGDGEVAEALILPEVDSGNVDAEVRFRAARLLANRYKRDRRWSEAIDLWNRLRQCEWANVDQMLYPLVELSKVYEHQLREFEIAIRYVQRAMNICELYGSTGAHKELVHRYSRLRRRAGATMSIGRV
ncbi:MAG: ribonuclease H-like domain-containing protein [Thermomicrobiaceae bacterium]